MSGVTPQILHVLPWRKVNFLPLLMQGTLRDKKSAFISTFVLAAFNGCSFMTVAVI
jgi:hypothetical protein